MARPIQYNKEQIIQQMMDYFWKHGYEDVSVDDLITKLKFNRTSFYKLFKDKDGAYLAALTYYIEQGSKNIQSLIREKKGLDA